jgi:hypothetical protein
MTQNQGGTARQANAMFPLVILSLFGIVSGCADVKLYQHSSSKVSKVIADTAADQSRLQIAIADVSKILDRSKSTSLYLSMPSSDKNLDSSIPRVIYSSRGTVSHLSGRYFALPLSTSKAGYSDDASIAYDFLVTYYGLHGLDMHNDDFLIESTVSRKGGGAYVRFLQYHDGIKVDGSSVTVVVDSSKQVIGYMGQSSPDITTSSVPTLSSGDALAVLLKSYPSAKNYSTAILHYIDNGSARAAGGNQVPLSWKVIMEDGSNRAWEIEIDANSGDILMASELQRNWQSAVYVETSGTNPLLRRGPYDFYCHCCSPEDDPAPPCNSCACLSGDALATWNGQQSVINYLWNRFNRNGYDNDGSSMDITIDANEMTAHYSYFWNNVTINPLCANSGVIGHEWHHGIVDDEIDLNTELDPAALDEGLSDCMGAMVQASGWSLSCSGYNVHNLQSPQANGYRDYKIQGATTGFNSGIISNACYLVARQTSQPVLSCLSDSECASNHCGTTSTFGNGDLTGKCIHARNSVWIPYVGMYHGYPPFLHDVTNHILSSNSSFTDYYYGTLFAADEYDESAGYQRGALVGKAAYYALFATGLWEATGPTYYDHNPSNAIVTNNRPAMVDDFCKGCGENRLGMFFSGSTDNLMRWAYAVNGVDFTQPALAIEDGSQDTISIGSGLIGVPISATYDLQLFYKSPSTNEILVRNIDLNNGAPTIYSATSIGLGVSTNTTPTAARYNSLTYIVWKDSSTTQLKYKTLGEQTIYNIPQAYSTKGPTATVAAGRLWVIYRGDGSEWDARVYYTSYANGSWTTPAILGGDNSYVKTQESPDAYSYLDRIWVGHANRSLLNMVSFIPQSSGAISDVSRAVPLQTSELYYGDILPFISIIRFNAHLRVYHKRGNASTGVPIWQIAKLGSG